MSETLSISSQKPQNSAFDYEELRKSGIAYIEKTGSEIWTDYNVHDPGITILELLCYVLTDLSYRANNTIPDLLATHTDTKANILKHFFTAAQIFPNTAVTINDYRKLVIDILGVKNVWLQKRSIGIFADIRNKRLQFTQPDSGKWEPVDVLGYYDVLIEFDTNVSSAGKEQIKTETKELLMQNRNLCEDFLSINEVSQQEFRLCSEIELKTDADPFDCLAKLFFNIQLYLTPLIKFYSLKDLQDQGYTSDVIFEGPLLIHGFIKEEELTASDLKREIHLSDIMQQMLNVSGVTNILDILFNPTDQVKELANKWIIPVKRGRQAIINIVESNVLLYKNGIPLRPDMHIIKSKFELLMNDYIRGNDLVRTDDITFDTGTFEDTGSYYSFQNHFPKNYGISHWGLSDDATAERVAQKNQLQGYLYFFDQQLANSFSQLSNLNNLFSTETQANTYFAKAVKSFKDFDKIFVNSSTIDDAVLEAVEDKTTYYKRRNLFLDHLLSRYSESFSEYVNVLYSGFTSNPKDVISPTIINQEDIVQDKANFLKNYPEYSAKRFSAYNYTAMDDTWDSQNISGLEKRLERLLGFDNLKRRNLVNIFTEIQHGLNPANNDEFWFRIIDFRNRETLLEGNEKFPEEEAAKFALDDSLSMIYNPINLKIIDNGDNTFQYQVLTGDKVLGTSSKLYSSNIEANVALQQFVLFVTQNRAEEGLFLIEHMLLLPSVNAVPDELPAEENFDGLLPICVDESCKDCEDKDPYSFRISIVLPAYAPRFLNMGFRQYCERTIRMESPAHIFVKICWVSNEQLVQFENAYKNWLEVKSGKLNDPGNEKLYRFVIILTALKSIYPVARLEDCSSSEERTLFLLNQNALGTLKT
ncbi:response regulator receiver modulated diguanylate cyclase/phosphodiesterase (GGDEF & EAL domains) with PAS/PAC sensor(s) [Arcticibacter svalbardensis MN12-7]|uniref:Response regulator receiver modulated diguanylate cyclase/phosphodiesterase (GGDEF & EAL domains) with PAS/PAC sensor(S) n=1 Tax=Arcticibacter svalbardensis MN12-7 TaxID=1150600 RepID=R9GZT4_9SPHI|nr:hypothetical protein [Arcticibacter svalbardensis]EOR94499.1 response regulator receiver modulated diguanylate cyclase/phosphodiesterase (GGDEF & EAL domains) with PAS/PAC sensor(s) [Arcticibacter svalbardensis MN12-7]